VKIDDFVKADSAFFTIPTGQAANGDQTFA
jgi:hypothetical protein